MGAKQAWLRRRAELANLPEVLVLEYFHPGKTTIRHHDVQERRRRKTRGRA